MLSVRYIMSELEEIEREDNFRLKRFKEFKAKKNKTSDDVNQYCYCDTKPGKGDDYVCAICQQEDEKKKEPIISTYGFKTQSYVSEVIGDKASIHSSANQKCLDDLTVHLKKVISLTSQCKTEGLVSPSVDTFIYACNEVRCKLEEIDEKRILSMTNDAKDTSCEVCDNVREAQMYQYVPREESKKPIEFITQGTSCDVLSNEVQTTDVAEKEDLLGCFETKYKETVKVIKFRNDDGTISEEKQVVTVKTERKHPYKLNSVGRNTCCNIKNIDSLTSTKSKSVNSSEKDVKVLYKEVKETKSEDINHCMHKEQTNVRSCVSDSSKFEKRLANAPLAPETCKVYNKVASPKTSSTSFSVCCPKKCPSAKEYTKSKVSLTSNKGSTRILDNAQLKKDVSCECKVKVKTVCCDAIWKDVACSTTGLAESSDEVEKLYTKELDIAVPTNNSEKLPSREKSTVKTAEWCCDKKYVTRKSSDASCIKKCSKNSILSESKKSNTSKNASETNSHIELENIKMFKATQSPVKSERCVMPECEITPTTCCKIRIISHQDDESESKETKVQEVIFFGSILDAIKKILAPSKSEESVNNGFEDVKRTDGAVGKPCNYTLENSASQNVSAKSSVKSLTCNTCDTGSQATSDGIPSSTYVSCKGIERSQSSPQCNTKSNQKSISWSRERSLSDDNTYRNKTQDVTSKSVCCDNKRRTDKGSTTKCSLCGTELLSRGTKSDLESVPKSTRQTQSVTDDDSCVSCIEDAKSCRSIWRSGVTFPSNSNKNAQEEKSRKLTSSDNLNIEILEESSVNASKSLACKMCQTETLYHKPENTDRNLQENLKAGRSCPVCEKRDSKCLMRQQGLNKSENDFYSTAPNAKSDLLCSGNTPRSSRELTVTPQDIVAGVVMKDAATSTRRSDRYDVRPLEMVMSQRKNNCTCISDSYLIKGRRPRNPKRSRSCSSCQGDYF